MTQRTNTPSAEVRIRVMKRDRFQCTYCGSPGTDVELEIDHIHPVSKGGSHHMSNLTTACRKCNQTKGNRKMTPKTSNKDGVVGMFCHILKDGKLHNQGQIDSIQGEYALIQRFSWLDGLPTDILQFPMDRLMNPEECRLYATNDDLILGWLQDLKNRGELKESVAEAFKWQKQTAKAYA